MVADVIQNHLSEVLYLLTMDLPWNKQNSDEINSKKIQLLKQINTLTTKDVLVGQYKGNLYMFVVTIFLLKRKVVSSKR